MAAALPLLTSEAELLSKSAAIRQRPLVVCSESPSWLPNVEPTLRQREQRDQPKESLEITGVFRGRELTRKERRLASGIDPVDRLIGGGIVRGRISEIIGNPGAGKTSLAAAFAASVTARGEVAAWIDAGGGFDPASIATAGVDLARMLWVAMPANRNRLGNRMLNEVERASRGSSRPAYQSENFVDIRANDPVGDPANHSAAGRYVKRPASMIMLKAAEWILMAGGFGLVVIDCAGMLDFNGRLSAFTQSAALRLAYAAERSGAAVIVIAPHRMCGTFAALSLMLNRNRACFSRACSTAPVLFDGLTVEARVARNKLGGSGGAATWTALADPSTTACFASTTCFASASYPATAPGLSTTTSPARAAESESAQAASSPHASHLPHLSHSPHSFNLPKTAQSTSRRAAAR
jgi:RecA/RadA recombinase